ncbi:CAP domain-containing protein [Telmatospirillum sp. J64-1]|uniref:CAP domain-containing protein n=1 Tax=Telmatospirillum sp. J64-1 TaxID=2502183 RepID=UPI00163DA324|nr:CAP domain-containing protein [Telmatospirillum sp. J64-1]
MTLLSAPALAAALVTSLLAAGVQAREAPEDYVQWAEQALARPPDGMRIVESLEARVLDLTNQQRRGEGTAEAGELAPDEGLRRVARAHALDMLERDFFAHHDPSGRGPDERVALLDRRFIGGSGENLFQAVGSFDAESERIAATVVEGLMESPGHRRNMLDPEFTLLGVGAATAGDRLYVVQVFGRPMGRLDADLPLSLSPGSGLSLSIEPAAGQPEPPMADLVANFPEDMEITPDPIGRLSAPDRPGPYRLVVLFPEGEGRFAVAPGPMTFIGPQAAEGE